MLQAISPGNEVYSFRNNYPKKGRMPLTRNLRQPFFPSIKQTKDQTTATDELLKSNSYYKNNYNININIKSPDINLINNRFILNGINNSQNVKYNDSLNNNNVMNNFAFSNDKNTFYTSNKNNKNTKKFFNKNFKLKSIEKTLIKSNSCANIINKKQTLTVLNIPSNNLEKKVINNLINQNKTLRKSSSLPKINFNIKNDIKNNDSENNKCNYLYLQYNGSDNSQINNLKKKKYMVINSHKVIESLQSISMPNDNYGQKLIDILENRINSGYYRKIKFNFGKNENSQKYSDFQKDIYNKSNNKNDNKKKEKIKYGRTFLTDVYDEFLLPDKDNKYNYIIHKIFLNNILKKICNKMIEIRDVKNRLITKQEIRDEFINQINYLRDVLYKNKNINIINNNIFNINSNTNIINIDFSNNNSSIINEMSTIEELHDNSFHINTTNEGKDKDKQFLTNEMFDITNNNKYLAYHSRFNKYINIEEKNNKDLDKIHIKYKDISKIENNKLLDLIKNKLKIKNIDISLHDTFSKIYLNNKINKINKGSPKIQKIKNIIKKNLYEKNYIPSLTETYYSEEKKLNNVDKFILNTKKLRYTFNTYENMPKKERNYSYDLEGNIHYSFDSPTKFNIVNFDDIYEEIERQFHINNHTYATYAKIETIKEMMRYFLNNKNNNIFRLKFNNKLVQKYIAMIASYKILNKKKYKNKIIKKKKLKNILEDISKKLHKKIKIKGGKIINTESKETKLKKHYNTEDNIKDRKRAYHLTDISNKSKNEYFYTDNIYLEIETNSSEYTDVPSQLDTEIEEMIRKKREREKGKEDEEGIYAPKKEDKNKDGVLMISNKVREEKEKEKKNSIKSNEEKNDDNKLKDENTNTNFPDNDIDKISNIYLNSNIDQYLKKNDINNEINVSKSFKGNKNLIRSNTLHLTKSSTSTNTTNGKPGIINMKLDLDNNQKKASFRNNSFNLNNIKDINDERRKNKNKDIKNLVDFHLKKNAILENIIEEESKETKRPRPSQENKNKKRKKTKKKTRKKKTIRRRNIKINSENSSLNKSPSSATSDYEAYSLNNDIMTDNKSNNVVISSKYNNNNNNNNNNNDISQNITNFNNNIENKENINKDNKFDIFNKKEETSSDEEIIEYKYNTFYRCGSKLFIEDFDIDKDNKYNIYYKTISYFDSFKKKIDKIMSLKKKKKKEENKKKEKSEEKIEENEEDGKRERIKRVKKTISVKGVKGLFLDDNNIEINKEKETEEETEDKNEEIPKKFGWEEKFELFKKYIHELKGMTDKQFKNDSMKYLNDIEKEDFSGKAKLSQVERINKYKDFLLKVEKKRNDFSNYYASHIIFTPGCIFNTGEIFK